MTTQAYCPKCGELHDVGGACAVELAAGYGGDWAEPATPAEDDGFVVSSLTGAVTASAFGIYMGGYAHEDAALAAIRSVMTLRNERRPIWRRRGSEDGPTEPELVT